MDAVTTVPIPVNEPVRDYAPGSSEREALLTELARIGADVCPARAITVITRPATERG